MPGFTHPVTDVYLDDILPLIGFQAAGRFAERPRAGDSKPRLTAEEQANVDEALMQTFLDAKEGCFEDLLEVSLGCKSGFQPPKNPAITTKRCLKLSGSYLQYKKVSLQT